MSHPPFRPIFTVTVCIALCFSRVAAGSGNGNSGNHYGKGPTVNVTISPTSSTLQIGQSQQFSASVSATNNPAVNWLVNGVLGGNSTVGTISSSGWYTAPLTVPSASVSVTAQSASQPTASASAPVSISPAPTVSVSISPLSANLQVSQSQQFSASVSGASNTAVNWLVNGVLGGNSSVGTINASGVYTAPAAVPSSSVSVTAQSTAQASASESASVSITPVSVSVSISPTTANLLAGQSQQFMSTVWGTSNTAVNWLVNGSLGGNSSVGTITTTGVYTAPASTPSAAVTVTAQSSANPSSSALASVSISQPYVSLTWNPSTSSVAGYYIYRSTQATGPFAKLNSSLDTATLYTDNSVTASQTYYYATTAVDSTGVESAYSNIVLAVIP